MRVHVAVALGGLIVSGCSSAPTNRTSAAQSFGIRDNVRYSAYKRWYRSTDVVDSPAEPVGGMAAFIAKLDYPRGLRQRHMQGKVYVQVSIAPSGQVKSARVIQSAGAQFDAIVLRAVHAVQWKPAMRGGKPVPFTFAFPVSFVRPT